MKEQKWKDRDRKRDKKKHGMRVSGRSIFTITRKIKKDVDETNKKNQPSSHKRTSRIERSSRQAK